MATGMGATNASAMVTDNRDTGIWPTPTDPTEFNHSTDIMAVLTTQI